MSHVISSAHLRIFLKFLRHAEMDLNLSQSEWYFAHQEGLQMHLNKGQQHGCFTVFEMLKDGCSKNSRNVFSKTPINAFGWMKKIMQK